MSKEVTKASQFAKAELVFANDLVLSPEQKQELDALYGHISSDFSSGKLVVGKVIEVDASGVLVDVNYKSNGHIPAYEFSDSELKNIKVGDDIEVIIDEVENLGGEVVLSYEQAKTLKAWKRITELFEQNKPVEGVVINKVKGGLSVDVGVPAFLPGSQVDLHRVTDFDQFVGQTITAEIIKINKKRGNIIISRRKFLAERREESRKLILDTLEEGKVIQGIVKNITNYGVFIDVGSVDGLLHITDMTWGRISHPSEIVKIGQSVAVKVLTIDKDNYKISLGMKQLDENPWKDMDQSIQVGSRVKGKVASVTDYGVFVEVHKGVEGLIHISEISWTERISDLSSRFAVGQEVEAVVVFLDVENRRMSLSIKQLEKNPWVAVCEQFQAGQKITGTISNVTDFGIFVQLMPGVDGLVHVSDLSWTEHIDHPANHYKRGDKIEAVILSIDQDAKKVALGIKQLVQDPWTTVAADYPVGALVKGTVSKMTNFGAFVKLASGIEGLVYNSELVENQDHGLAVGVEREFRVVNVNAEERKLGLSILLDGKKEREVREPREAKSKSAAPRAAGKKEAAPKAATSATSSGPKAKSAFQLELEKHMTTTDDKE